MVQFRKWDERLRTLMFFALFTIGLNLLGFVLARIEGYYRWPDIFGIFFVSLMFLLPAYLLFFIKTRYTWAYFIGFLALSCLLYYGKDDMCKGDFVDAMLTGIFQMSAQVIVLLQKVIDDVRLITIAIVFIQTFGTFLFSRWMAKKMEER